MAVQMTMSRGMLRELVVTMLWLAWLTTAHAETKNPITAITGLPPPRGFGPVQEIVEIPTTPPLTIIVAGLGGYINSYVEIFWRVRLQGGPVQVRGMCASACTVVMSIIPKDRLCFTEGGFLRFHTVRKNDVPDIEATRNLIGSYPEDIQGWINAKGATR